METNAPDCSTDGAVIFLVLLLAGLAFVAVAFFEAFALVADDVFAMVVVVLQVEIGETPLRKCRNISFCDR